MIEKIVTSLEVSKKLKDLGILQESCFYWVEDGPRGWGIWMKVYRDRYRYWFNVKQFSMPMNWEPEEPISAFTVTELGMMLDLMTTDIDDDYLSHCWPDNQARHGIFEMLDQYRLPDGKLAFDGMIENLNKNLKEWREG